MLAEQKVHHLVERYFEMKKVEKMADEELVAGMVQALQGPDRTRRREVDHRAEKVAVLPAEYSPIHVSTSQFP
jgi:hypothetical protein